LGIALHPWQDWVAHGDYGLIERPNIWTTHNAHGPKTASGGTPWTYPDRPDLDVENSPDGRADKGHLYLVTIETPNTIPPSWDPNINQTLSPSINRYDVANFVKGTKRYDLTKEKTDEALNDFKNYLQRSVASTECKCYFLGKI